MTWNWDEFTAPDFARAVKKVHGVCLLPIGIQEMHGTHLPLGMDTHLGRAVAQLAVEREPAIVFPPYYFGQTVETKTRPGAIAIRSELQFDLLENVCEEIARNGLRKIVLLNSHGGNEPFLTMFGIRMLERRRDYHVYAIKLSDYWHAVMNSPAWRAMMASPYDWHAGEMETSVMLALRAELVKMDEMSAPGVSRERLAHLPSKSITPLWWNADWPDQYAGDATHATAEKGRYLLEQFAERVAAHIKAVKEDTVVAQLAEEFYSESE